jgi:hypothetical protein
MPRYVYECCSCEEQFEISHSMSHEQEECILCKKIKTIKKIPSFLLKKHSSIEAKSKPGRVVDEFIKDAKKDLQNQKRDLKMETLD